MEPVGVEHRRLFMGEHGPEAIERLGWNARTQEGNVTLQVGANEVLAPTQAVGVARGQEAISKSAARP